MTDNTIDTAIENDNTIDTAIENDSAIKDAYYEYLVAWGKQRSLDLGFSGDVPVMPGPQESIDLYVEYFGELPPWHAQALAIISESAAT